jgi:mannose-6-phosphate isomerase-like protein (cupin superfamily)
MHPTETPFRFTVEEAVRRLPAPAAEGLRFATLFRRGSLAVELYAPQGEDLQQPHAQDELYVVLTGTGWFVNGGVRHPFGPGDVLFVPAGAVHRFEDFTPDFRTWVVFYGPPGGEPASP